MMVHPRQQTVRQPAGADVEQHSGDLVGSEVGWRLIAGPSTMPLVARWATR